MLSSLAAAAYATFSVTIGFFHRSLPPAALFRKQYVRVLQVQPVGRYASERD